MTATPHNGKEEDFQLFMALIDPDRFEGKFRDRVNSDNVSDLMRRMVKEDLLKFDGTPLFPDRIAHTVPYKLSEAEAQLYEEVTNYVREEFNRAEKLENDGRAGTVGFALTVLQRRLASSPEAIYQSLRRRKERLEGKMVELEQAQRSGALQQLSTAPTLDAEDVEDLEDAPDYEVEAVEEEFLVSVRKHIESDESFVIQERWADSKGTTDVDEQEPRALRPQQVTLPERFDRRGMGACPAADRASQARWQQASRRGARSDERDHVYFEHGLPVAGDPERPAAALDVVRLSRLVELGRHT
jgi:hypothetical protein